MPASSLTPLKRQLARRIAACVGNLNLRQVEAAEMLELTQPRVNALPKVLRDALHLQTGDALRAVKIANAIVLTPQRRDLDTPRKQIRRLMKKRGVSAEELLRDL